MPLKIKYYLQDLLFMHTKHYVLHCFQDQVLPKPQTRNDCKHCDFFLQENCIDQETATWVHQLQLAHQWKSFLELLQNLYSDWLAKRLQTLISAIRGEGVNKTKASFSIIVYLFIIIASTG